MIVDKNGYTLCRWVNHGPNFLLQLLKDNVHYYVIGTEIYKCVYCDHANDLIPLTVQEALTLKFSLSNYAKLTVIESLFPEEL